MKFLNKHININLFILLAGFVVLMHSVTPHDHHSNVDISHNESKDDCSNAEHCHLLNDIALDKAISISKKNISKPLYSDFGLLYIVNTSFVKNRQERPCFSDINNLSYYLVFGKSTPTRGSPICI